jgi:mono/diheme cytochrome c family protein
MFHCGHGMKRGAIAILSCIALLAFQSLSGVAAPETPNKSPTDSQVTFNRDIAPILFHSCGMCHRPGESGPFPLLTSKDAKSHARQIAAVTQSRFMPPWLPDPGDYKFADNMRLSDEEVALIARWVQQGAVEGTPAELPKKPEFVEGFYRTSPVSAFTRRLAVGWRTRRYSPRQGSCFFLDPCKRTAL